MIYVLIDIDETMVSLPSDIDTKASAKMFQKVFGVAADEFFIDPIGKTEMMIIRNVLEKVGLKIDKVPQIAYKTWGEADAEALKGNPPRVLPGIPELLNALSKNPKIKLELLTGNAPCRAEAKLNSVHLDNFFRNPITKELTGTFGNMAYKRDELFDLIKKKAQLEDKFIIVDDSLLGGAMAKKYHLPAILVATGKATKEQLEEFTANVFLDFGDHRWQKAVSIIKAI